MILPLKAVIIVDMFPLLSEDDFILWTAGDALLLVYDHLVVVLPGGGVHYFHLKLHPGELCDPIL